MKAALLVLVVTMAPRCTPPAPSPDAPAPPPLGVADSGSCARCSSPCACACCVMGSYNGDGGILCREALPTARGRSCEVVCEDTSKAVGGAWLPTFCVAKAASLDELRACGVCRPAL